MLHWLQSGSPPRVAIERPHGDLHVRRTLAVSKEAAAHLWVRMAADTSQVG